MILPNGTVVAVADGATFKLFQNKGAEPAIDLAALEVPALATGNSGAGLRHHDSNDNPDNDRRTEDRFAAAIAERLNGLALDGTIDKLVVIADPRTLGELRRGFNAKLQGKVIGELAKDLTGHSVQEIVAALRNA